MTQKEFYQAVASQTLSDEVVAYAKERYDKLAAPTQSQLESEYIATAILEDETLVSFFSADLAGRFATTTSKVARVLKDLYEGGKLTREMDEKGKCYKYTKVIVE